jgi:exopolyphosphatase/guanosine-5'-triphosphate,3'-diphosphate pyrophosphatase
MTATGHEVVDICPWSTKEGLLITMLEQPAHHAGGDVIAVA